MISEGLQSVSKMSVEYYDEPESSLMGSKLLDLQSLYG